MQVAAGDMGSIPGLGRSPGGGRGNPLQYSWLGNPMDRGAWRPRPYGHKELDMSEATWHTHIVFYQARGFWSILLSNSIY